MKYWSVVFDSARAGAGEGDGAAVGIDDVAVGVDRLGKT